MKVLVVLVIRLNSQEEYKEEKIIALSADKLPGSQECGREGDEGLLTGEKIRGREIKDQGKSCQGGLIHSRNHWRVWAASFQVLGRSHQNNGLR